MTTGMAGPEGLENVGRPQHASPAKSRPGRRGSRGEGHSLLAQGEPIVWVTGAGLVVCMAMIAGLLLLVIYHGLTTFWPGPIVQVELISGEKLWGEITRYDQYALRYSSLAKVEGPRQQAGVALLNRPFRDKLERLLTRRELAEVLDGLRPRVAKSIAESMKTAADSAKGTQIEWHSLQQKLDTLVIQQAGELNRRLMRRMAQSVSADQDGSRLFALWQEMSAGEQTWLDAPQLASLSASLVADGGLPLQIWGNHALSLLSGDVTAPMHRRLMRTGNYDLTGRHFTWISDFELARKQDSLPPWAILLERMAWGRFYGKPTALKIDGQAVATEPARILARLDGLHAEVRARWKRRRRLETVDTGEVNRHLERARLDLRQVELDYGKASDEWRAANAAYQAKAKELDVEFARIRSQIKLLDTRNARYQLVVTTAGGQQKEIALADIVRAYPANRLNLAGKFGIYVSRWWEFLSDEPRYANSEGGVFPAIWGTVTMTLLMSLAVVPFGVLAALYLREYARKGLPVSIVRIAVNNLAGVPSIVFGVFGLGFFCYIVGASIDKLFFASKLPNPTFGTGGLMWAALTLALLTLPVVIVATEEALAAVPRSMREGSLACGATKWQTIRRIVLPRALPGIMTGAILAMARGAGEVAPLMLVGVMKVAPKLPVDRVFPYVHLDRSFMHLGFHIYDLGFQSQNSEAAKPMVFTTTLLLISIIFFLNLLAIWLRARLRRKFEYSQF